LNCTKKSWQVEDPTSLNSKAYREEKARNQRPILAYNEIQTQDAKEGHELIIV